MNYIVVIVNYLFVSILKLTVLEFGVKSNFDTDIGKVFKFVVTGICGIIALYVSIGDNIFAFCLVYYIVVIVDYIIHFSFETNGIGVCFNV